MKILLGLLTVVTVIQAASLNAQAQSLCASVFSDAAPAMTLSELKYQQKLLSEGVIVENWATGNSSFGARFVRFADGNLGVWKDNNTKFNTARHEIAASRVDQHLGLFLIPATVEKTYMGVPGTVQRVIGPLNKKRFSEMLDEAGFLDYLIDNRDRSRNNFLQTEHGAMVAIDHGLSFGEPGNLRSEKAFETFKENVTALASIARTRKNLEKQAQDNPGNNVDALRAVQTLKIQESKLTSQIQIFAPEQAVIAKLKQTTHEQWEAVLGDTVTSSELSAMMNRQDALIQAFDRAESLTGKDTLYRSGSYSSIMGVIVKEDASAPAAAAKQLQNMKNRTVYGDY